MSNSTCAVIVVTHNSQNFLPNHLSCLEKQSLPASKVIFIDCGSHDDTISLLKQSPLKNKSIISQKNIGFCRANNLGVKLAKNDNYVLFLNPDAFLAEDFLEKAVAFMEDPKQAHCGALTGIMLGYDLSQNLPNGLYDSTGIFPSWYGKWHDRAQGQIPKIHLYRDIEEVPAICGALFFARKAALESVLLHNDEVFDARFFMYKEDIDLSLRLKKAGWKLYLQPELIAYHCRGWKGKRSLIPKASRLLSAKNELALHLRHRMPLGCCYSFAKYLGVKLFNF